MLYKRRRCEKQRLTSWLAPVKYKHFALTYLLNCKMLSLFNFCFYFFIISNSLAIYCNDRRWLGYDLFRNGLLKLSDRFDRKLTKFFYDCFIYFLLIFSLYPCVRAGSILTSPPSQLQNQDYFQGVYCNTTDHHFCIIL